MRERSADQRLLDSLLDQGECEWVEFKKSTFDPQRIGRYASALSNGARLHDKPYGYLAWGISNDGRVIGTEVDPPTERIGQQPFEFWLKGRVTPQGHPIRLRRVQRDGKKIVLLEVGAAFGVPTRFERIAYIRIGDATPPLEEHPDREKDLLTALVGGTFETEIAIDNVHADEVFDLLAVAEALELISRRPPKDDRTFQLEQLRGQRMIARTGGNHWSISNRAAILFARNLADFGVEYQRRAPRVVFYKRDDRVSTEREQTGTRGYALGLKGLFEWLESRLPRSEVLRGALRVDSPVYPPEALRELISNALIHQDFALTGTGPMIEVFSERLEISNPGVPLVAVDRMLDEQPRSRNEKLAFAMRQMGFAEERGSGIDKVIFGAEVFQLPAPAFEVRTNGFTATIFAPREYGDMTPEERIRACYQHASLLWASGRRLMTNTSLRARFGLGDHRASQISRLIGEALEAGAIKAADPENRSKAQAAYRPYWA